MLQSRFSRPLIIVGWVTLLIGVLCLLAYCKTTYDTMRFEKDGINTEATIIDFYENQRFSNIIYVSGSPKWIKFSYRDESGQTYTNTDAYLLSNASDLQRNTPITIRYLKHTPSISRLLSRQEVLKQGYMDSAPIVLTLVIMVGIGLILLGKNFIIKDGEL